MATKKKSESHPEETASEPGVLEKAAKAIGAAVGTVAAKTGLAKPAQPAKKKKVKLISKGKKRLPRKEKKRLQKAAAKKSVA